jgi:coatomer protein complex subunit alpha (xenin)
MIVFKLDRERPAYAAHGGTLYYVKERYLRAYDYQSQRDNPLISIRRTSTAGAARLVVSRMVAAWRGVGCT